MENGYHKSLLAWVFVACGLWASASAAHADELFVRVFSNDQKPVPGVAVFVRQQGSQRAQPATGVMDQRDHRFVPHILIVQKGAVVEFPNSDVVAHHVYSFSKPNNFELPLYKGSPPDPVLFEHEGVVTLGCNIHDGMLGYIVVVDTDTFAMTDADGLARLKVDGDAGRWEVNAWSPRIRDSRDPLVEVIEAGEPLTATFALQKKLRPAHDDQSESVSWDDY
ncbi:MAG TPA: methylamine utilization protein [Woeseiaceae bacterium]|jgi:plastocyanin|nr:methylamine utilization protein [Woeseiaceae bacterium]